MDQKDETLHIKSNTIFIHFYYTLNVMGDFWKMVIGSDFYKNCYIGGFWKIIPYKEFTNELITNMSFENTCLKEQTNERPQILNENWFL